MYHTDHPIITSPCGQEVLGPFVEKHLKELKLGRTCGKEVVSSYGGVGGLSDGVEPSTGGGVAVSLDEVLTSCVGSDLEQMTTVSSSQGGK